MANSLINGDGKLNVKNYTEKVKKQRETFSQIDSTMAILEKLPDFVDSTLDFLNANSFTFSTSPLGFIFNILKSLGVEEETLKEWIVEILVYTLPTVEIGIKASLLANIKSIISCNADPRIPLRLRKKVSDSVYTNILKGANEERGININVDAIDPEGLLDLSPFSDPGKQYYFGCTDDTEYDTSIMKVVSKYDDGLNIDTENVIGDGNSKIAKLARADDFNAFLWYVIHSGNRQNPSRATINGSILTIDGDDVAYNITSGNKGLLGTMEITAPSGRESNIIAGNTFYDSNNANYIAICIESKIDKNTGKITGNTIVPVSSDWFSCNWYVDKTNYYSSNIGIKKAKPRNYSEEKAICNLRFCEQRDYINNSSINNIPGTPNNIRFTILPKPYVLLPSVDTEDRNNDGKTDKIHVQWRPIRLLFDYDGTPNQKGKFSLISETYNATPTLTNKETNGDYTYYNINGIKENDVVLNAARLVVNTKTGKYKLEFDDPSKLTSILVECYPGLTVYEFNYDYIMGMKLFDPKVVCQKIFDNAANPKYNASFQLTLNKTKDKLRYPFLSGKQKIIEIVQSILEEDEDEINDCFYNFSNEQYDEMLNKTEEIKYRQMPLNQGYGSLGEIDFSEVNAILNSFPENGSLEDQKNVINHALTKACNLLDDISTTDKGTLKIDFLTNILQQLVSAIVDSILSPKVLMLLMINKSLMETQVEEPFSTEGLMRILKNIIKSLIREVRDLIIKKLLDYILQYLTPLALQLQTKILSEQFAAYMAIIKLLLLWFNKGVQVVSRLSSILSSILSKFKKRHEKDFSDIDLPSILDEFTYADIYTNDVKDNEPVNNNC